MTILLCPQKLQRKILDPCNRIVIPIGAPKERSGGTCGFFGQYSHTYLTLVQVFLANARLNGVLHQLASAMQ